MIDRIKETFEKDKGFIGHNKFKIVELSKEECKTEYVIEEIGLNPAKIVHGAIIYGLAANTSGALASMNEHFPLTISSSINYLSPGKGKKIYAVAHALKEGKTIGYYEVKIYDESDTLIATANINMFFSDLMK